MSDRDTYQDELATGKTQTGMPAIPRDSEDRVSSGDLSVSFTPERREATDRQLIELVVESLAQQHSTIHHMANDLRALKDTVGTMSKAIAHTRDMMTIQAMQRTSTSGDELGGTVLLMVEDNKPLVSALRRILTEAGAAVHVAYTADEGRHQVRMLRDALTCCILDVHLPDEQGFGLAQSVRHWLPRVGLVLTSGYDDLDLEEAAHRLTGCALVKSFDARTLIDSVAAAIMLAGARAAE